MKRRTGISVLAAVVAAAFVMGFSAAARADGIPAQETWINVQKMVGTVRPGPGETPQGKDNFVIAATFNCKAFSFGPSTDVTLSIDELDIAIPADQWQKKGNTEKYLAQTANYTAQIDYWIKGSSRCNLKLSARNQDMLGNIPNMPNLPVELTIGDVFDESVIAEMGTSGNGAKMLDLGPAPLMVIDTLMIKKNPRLAGKDSLTITGRCWTDSQFDTATDGVFMQIDEYSVTIPAGAIENLPNGKGISYRGVIDGANVSFKADQSAKFTMVIKNADLSGVTNPVTLDIVLTGIPDAAWGWALDLQSNGPGTVMNY